MKAIVEITREAVDDNDEYGWVHVELPSGKVSALWSCVGGKGRGAEVQENNSKLSDVEADALVNCSSIYQGIGKFFGSVEVDLYSHFVFVPE